MPKYKIIKNYKDGYDAETFKEKYTDYFDNYDYILGDWSYGKLRLKGFCKKENEIYNKINDIEKIDEYIKLNCAYDCKYFIVEKIKD